MSDARTDRLEARLTRIEQAIIRIEGDLVASCGQGRTRRQTEPALQAECQGCNDRRLYRGTRPGRRAIVVFAA
jgi:hypothetical protein